MLLRTTDRCTLLRGQGSLATIMLTLRRSPDRSANQLCHTPINCLAAWPSLQPEGSACLTYCPHMLERGATLGQDTKQVAAGKAIGAVLPDFIAAALVQLPGCMNRPSVLLQSSECHQETHICSGHPSLQALGSHLLLKMEQKNPTLHTYICPELAQIMTPHSFASSKPMPVLLKTFPPLLQLCQVMVSLLTHACATQPLGPGHVIFDIPVDVGEHISHFIAVGADNLLYFPLASQQNTGPCLTSGNLSQCAMNRMQLDGSGVETLATGEHAYGLVTLLASVQHLQYEFICAARAHMPLS